MSGGSYDYAYTKIDDLADSISPTTPLRKAFIKHLRQVAKAAHDIEWVDSGDCGDGDENKAILACLGKDADVLVLQEVLSEALRVHAEMSEAIKNAQKGTLQALKQGQGMESKV